VEVYYTNPGRGLHYNIGSEMVLKGKEGNFESKEKWGIKVIMAGIRLSESQERV
jgi:hypothetical protein